jgi:hypothetical protein
VYERERSGGYLGLGGRGGCAGRGSVNLETTAVFTECRAVVCR